MKKKILSLVLAICLIIPCALMLSSCKLDLFNLRVNLNGGTLTQVYMESHNFSGNGTGYFTKVNPKLYDNFSRNIPNRGDMTPPEGKVFAGWYLNQECTPDYYFNKTNWNRVVEEKRTKESKSASIYAYWIDETDIALSFDLEGFGLEFTQSYKSELGINHNSLRFIGTPTELMTMIPEEDDIIVPEDRYFKRWALDQYGQTELSEANLELFMQTNADIKVYPIWDMRISYNVSFSTYINLTNETNTDFYSFQFDDEIFNEYGNGYDKQVIRKTVWEEEFAEIQSFIVGLEDHIELSIHAEK